MQLHRHIPDGRLRVIECNASERDLLTIPELGIYTTRYSEELEHLPLAERHRLIMCQLNETPDTFIDNGNGLPTDHNGVLSSMFHVEKMCRILAACGLPYNLNTPNSND